MSWHNRQIITKEEAMEDALNVPAGIQVGGDASFFIQLEEDGDESTLEELEAIVVGVKISNCHAITYDLALPIKGTHLYAVVKDIRGWTVPLGEKTDAVTGGLVGKGALLSVLKEHLNDIDDDDDGYIKF